VRRFAVAAGGPEAMGSDRNPPCRRAKISLQYAAGKLANLLATTLDQNDQQNDRNNAGDDPDNCCIVHVSSPFLLLKIKKAF
jgi:hypothetical protein